MKRAAVRKVPAPKKSGPFDDPIMSIAGVILIAIVLAVLVVDVASEARSRRSRHEQDVR